MSATVAKLEKLIVSTSSKFIGEIWYNGISIDSFNSIKELMGLRFVLKSNEENTCLYTSTKIEKKLEYYGQK